MLDEYFGIRRHGSTVLREILAGMTTFLAMAYIVAVNPGILEVAGLPKEATAIATCIAAAIGTLLMGFYARRPIGIAPYMGENAFIAFTVVGMLGYSWQQALAAIFAAGVLFLVLTMTGLRGYLANAVPRNLRFSFVVGIGLFLAFIGLEKIGFIARGPGGGPPVALGNLTAPATLVGIAAFLLMGLGLLWRIPGSILGVIAAAYGAGILLGISPRPAHGVMQLPALGELGAIASLWPFTDWHLDFSAFAHPAFLLAVFLPVFLMDFFDTIGTLIGVSARAGFLDARGELPEIEKPMVCDAVASMAGAVVGTTTTGAYIESAAGIEMGGRTGLTAVTTGVLFVVALFFAPVFTAIPAYAYAPALIIVGVLMMESVKEIDVADPTEVIPAFAVIVLMPFTFNIGVGMAAGFILHPLLKFLGGRTRELSFAGLAFAAASLLFFIFYPYGS
jgi:adenine/guanine/hypoxanthine permease